MSAEDLGTYSYGEDLRPGERRPAAYAASALPSRGREHAELECPTRSPFQRDRDRIIHSTPFRRLLHKTQVFLFHEGDHYRTRLTHSLEVAQIARTIARQLRLDEDLAEALALAHDLGHPPFGHAGERALDRAMERFGGFNHNAQSLKIVMLLDRKYDGFDGLNLTWETLEGLAKHNGPIAEADPSRPRAVGELVSDPVWKVALLLRNLRDLQLWKQGSAEAQVAALADDIAYVSHDVDDGLRAHLLEVDQLKDAPLAGPIAQQVLAVKTPGLDRSRAVYGITRAMITLLIQDCVTESRRRLRELGPRSADDIRDAKEGVIAFSDPVAGGRGTAQGHAFCDGLPASEGDAGHAGRRGDRPGSVFSLPQRSGTVARQLARCSTEAAGYVGVEPEPAGRRFRCRHDRPDGDCRAPTAV